MVRPVALAEPAWVPVGATVAALLLLTAREKLHGLARQIETSEIVTAGKFLLLAGFVLPLLPNQPVSPLTDITPYQVWMALLAVCTVSYASYLLQRYVAPAGIGLWYWLHRGRIVQAQAANQPGNPLELNAAIIFAALFVLISLASAWAQSRFGATGLYLLAAIVGVSDIDPFVLSLAEHGAGQMPLVREVVAILIATSSNNLLKAGYTVAFAGIRPSLPSAAALGVLALCGLGIAAWMAGTPQPS